MFIGFLGLVFYDDKNLINCIFGEILSVIELDGCYIIIECFMFLNNGVFYNGGVVLVFVNSVVIIKF